MDTHHGVVDGWKDNIYSFTPVKRGRHMVNKIPKRKDGHGNNNVQ